MLRLEGLTTSIALPDIPLSPAARDLVAAHPRLWRHVLADGDDYEILCAVPPDRADAFAARRGGQWHRRRAHRPRNVGRRALAGP